MTGVGPAGRAAQPAVAPWVWALLAVIALLVLNGVRDPGFLRVSLLHGKLFGSPVDILSEGARPLVVALGMTIVIATGGVDLSVGSVVAIAGACAALALQGGSSAPVAVAAAIGAGLLAGGVNALLIAGFGIQPIVATLILMVAGRGVAQLLVGGQVIVITQTSFEFLSTSTVAGLPVAPVFAGGLFVLAWLALRKTAAGLFIEAAGDNPTAGRFAGLSVGGVKTLAYVACGGLAGFAGALAAANIRAADAYRAGENMELDAIFAAVIGGTALTGGRFSLMGSFCGAILLQTLATTLYHLGVPPAIAPVPKAVLILAVCLAQSETLRSRLFGRRRQPQSV
jgi:galactofuranose transport system permease protein